VRGYQVRLLASQADGFVREWRPEIMSPETHFGYAVQWFSFAAAVVAIYIAVNLKKQKPDDR